MRGRKADAPRVSVLCRCGAQWFGGYAIDNPAIGYHAQRCGPPISAEAFAALGFTMRPPASWRAADTVETEGNRERL